MLVRPSDHSHSSGFTLIEIMIVLAILALSLTIALTHGPSHSARLEMRAGAAQFADVLRRAQSQAILSGRVVNVVIDPRKHEFAADKTPARDFAANTDVSILPGTMALPHDQSLIRFAPDGSASGGGIILSGQHHKFRVEVEWLTGTVKVSDAP